MSPRRKSAKQLQAICDRFNAKHPIGTRGVLRKDSGELFPTATKTRAEVLQGHSAVIWLDGIVGCYLLDRFIPDGTAKPKPRPPLLGSGKPIPF